MLDRISNHDLHNMAPCTRPIAAWIRKSQLRWVGHLARREDSYLPKQMLFAHHVWPMASRPSGRPPACFPASISSMISSIQGPVINPIIQKALEGGVEFRDRNGVITRRPSWYDLAQNRCVWSVIVESAMEHDI